MHTGYVQNELLFQGVVRWYALTRKTFFLTVKTTIPRSDCVALLGLKVTASQSSIVPGTVDYVMNVSISTFTYARVSDYICPFRLICVSCVGISRYACIICNDAPIFYNVFCCGAYFGHIWTCIHGCNLIISYIQDCGILHKPSCINPMSRIFINTTKPFALSLVRTPNIGIFLQPSRDGFLPITYTVIYTIFSM